MKKIKEILLILLWIELALIMVVGGSGGIIYVTEWIVGLSNLTMLQKIAYFILLINGIIVTLGAALLSFKIIAAQIDKFNNLKKNDENNS